MLWVRCTARILLYWVVAAEFAAAMLSELQVGGPVATILDYLN